MEYYFEAPSMSHLNVLWDDNKMPMERNTVNSILDTNDPMPTNECQKADKSKKTPTKELYIKTNAEPYKY